MPDRPVYSILPAAEADLEEIWLYTYQNWSRDQADRYYVDIVRTFEALADGVMVGRPAEVRRPGYMKCRIGSHFVYYRIDDDRLIIVRVLHSRMDVTRHLN